MKVLSAEVYCSGCSSPSFVPLREDESYLVMFPDYFSNSGVYTSLYANMTDLTSGMEDSEALVGYLADNYPIRSVDTGRLTILTNEGDGESGGGGGGSDGGSGGSDGEGGESGSSQQKSFMFVLLLASINYVCIYYM
ncbi:collagen alpha-1(XVII) chain-like [Agrilus planipennis]|uniref:Collagen alpha-1(XVII) chain-like n=1 Tax=Agrilus planipennis TaxID=224129 RepID=A0A1W4WEU2_AGRPL|nr:collagen alpha-1(XVII) chain-like [Agrilus planipennis]